MQIIFDHPEIACHKKTTAEIKACCADIKVLGRKELKLLLAWKKALSEEFGDKTPKEEATEEVVDNIKDNNEEQEEEEDDEDLKKVDKQILELQTEEQRDLKRKKKKVQKERKKLNEKLNLKMVIKGDSGPTMEGDDVFSLRKVTNINKLVEQAPDRLAESDDENDNKKKPKFLKYDKDEQHLSSSGLYYKDSDSELEMESDGEEESDIKEGLGLSDEDNSDEEKPIKKEKKNKKNALITDLDYRSKEEKKTHKAELWFERDIFTNLINEEDEDADLDKMVTEFKKKGAKIIGEDKNEDDSDYSSDSDYDVEQEMGQQHPINNAKKDGFEIVSTANTVGKKNKKGKLTVEELALGTLMVNSKKMKRDIFDDAWNRYAFNDDNLPDWFVKEEEKHMKKEAAVPKVSILLKI